MLTIRLTRKGKKNQPFFRVVVVDKRTSSKGGRSIEELGYVDPLTKRKSFKKERVLHWIKNGAQPSSTVHNLLVSEKIIEAKKVNVSKKSKKVEQTIAANTGIPNQSANVLEVPVSTSQKSEQLSQNLPVVESEKPAEPEKSV